MRPTDLFDLVALICAGRPREQHEPRHICEHVLILNEDGELVPAYESCSCQRRDRSCECGGPEPILKHRVECECGNFASSWHGSAYAAQKEWELAHAKPLGVTVPVDPADELIDRIDLGPVTDDPEDWPF